MTTQEFSTEFDVLYNNIASNGAPGINEYEKSVFLTKAQNELIKAYFLKVSNKLQSGYDDNALQQTNFSNLIVLKTYQNNDLEEAKYSSIANSKSVVMPKNSLFILNEQLLVTDANNKNKTLIVVPINGDAYSRLLSKPFKRPLKNQAWRLDVNMESTEDEQCADLIPTAGTTIKGYQIRYVKKPTPIILTTLEDGIMIDGEFEEMTCKLNPILHPEVLQRAVELAKASYTGELTNMLQLGYTSQTGIGQTTTKQ